MPIERRLMATRQCPIAQRVLDTICMSPSQRGAWPSSYYARCVAPRRVRSAGLSPAAIWRPVCHRGESEIFHLEQDLY